ncbi:MAG TPA: hypothetical protein VIM61_00555 [Chthoniobacterales bacterium]
MKQILDSLTEFTFSGYAVMLALSLVQIGAGLAVGAILWRPRRERGQHIPPHRRF